MAWAVEGLCRALLASLVASPFSTVRLRVRPYRRSIVNLQGNYSMIAYCVGFHRSLKDEISLANPHGVLMDPETSPSMSRCYVWDASHSKYLSDILNYELARQNSSDMSFWTLHVARFHQTCRRMINSWASEGFGEMSGRESVPYFFIHGRLWRRFGAPSSDLTLFLPLSRVQGRHDPKCNGMKARSPQKLAWSSDGCGS